MDAYGALLFQVVGQQLSVRATRAILALWRLSSMGAYPSRRRSSTPTQRRSGAPACPGARLTRYADSLSGSPAVNSATRPSCWTVHGFLIIALDRPDVVLSGDLALRRAIRHVYGLDQMPTEREVLQIAERWRPYRSLAVSYLFASEFEI